MNGLIKKISMNMDDKTCQALLKELKQEKALINKQMHIVKVVNAANRLEQLKNEHFFSNHHIDAIEFSYVDSDYNEEYYLNYNLITKNSLNTNFVGLEKLKEMENIIYSITNFIPNYLSVSMKNGKNQVNVDANFKEHFLTTLLSEELYSMLTYASLDNALKDKVIEQNKRKI